MKWILKIIITKNLNAFFFSQFQETNKIIFNLINIDYYGADHALTTVC